MDSANIYDVVSATSRNSVLAKIGSKTEDDKRKRFSVDFFVYKKSNNNNI